MKKLMIATAAGAVALLSGAGMAQADDVYPPSSNDPGSVQVVAGATLLPGAVPAAAPTAEVAVTAVTLPQTGSNDTMLLQLGGVTLLAGAALVGATAVRKRRSSIAD